MKIEAMYNLKYSKQLQVSRSRYIGISVYSCDCKCLNQYLFFRNHVNKEMSGEWRWTNRFRTSNKKIK